MGFGVSTSPRYVHLLGEGRGGGEEGEGERGGEGWEEGERRGVILVSVKTLRYVHLLGEGGGGGRERKGRGRGRVGGGGGAGDHFGVSTNPPLCSPPGCSVAIWVFL